MWSFKKYRILLLGEMRRDTQNLLTFGAKYLWIFFLCFIYGFFFKTAVWHRQIALNGHPIDFPLFLISGILAVRIIPFSVKIFEETLSGLTHSGLTEWVRLTRTSFWELFAVRAVWNFILALTELTALIFFAKLLIGTPLRPFFQTAMILPILLLFAAQAGIGMIICGFAVYLKKMDIFFNLFFQISTALGGVFFPAEMLRERLVFLSAVSDALPITHALRAMRFHLIHEEMNLAGNHELILAFLALFYFSAGFFILLRSLRWAKRNGFA